LKSDGAMVQPSDPPPGAAMTPIVKPLSLAGVQLPAAKSPFCTRLPSVTGASSETVILKSLASVTVSPSKSTACTRPERSTVADAAPLSSSGSSSVKVHEPLPLTVSVKTSSLLESSAVNVLPFTVAASIA
jgi:hypothetical protein